MSSEVVTLVFKDGARFKWKISSIHDSRMAIRMQRKHGDPSEIIGDGPTATILREKYALFKQDPENYKPDVFGTAALLSGKAREELEGKFKRFTERIRKVGKG